MINPTEVWCVYYIDIDPDTGLESNEGVIAFCLTQASSELIKSLIEKDYLEREANPNREFFVELINLS
jgi:hypothetical protein